MKNIKIFLYNFLCFRLQIFYYYYFFTSDFIIFFWIRVFGFIAFFALWFFYFIKIFFFFFCFFIKTKFKLKNGFIITSYAYYMLVIFCKSNTGNMTWMTIKWLYAAFSTGDGNLNNLTLLKSSPVTITFFVLSTSHELLQIRNKEILWNKMGGQGRGALIPDLR